MGNVSVGDQPAIDPTDPWFGCCMPELPNPGTRWTVRRKAAIVEAVRGGWVPVNEVCSLYKLSVDELLAWERDIDRYGVPGLRATRYQIYRITEAHKGRLICPRGDKLTNHLALSMLGECGIAVIWRLNVAAADAHRSGHPCRRGDPTDCRGGGGRMAEG